jgi:microcin C transport system permease protein
MTQYILRRLLLMIPTLLGITVACFILIQFVPGGPVEEIISKLQAQSSARGGQATKRISEEEVANIRAYFGFDKPAHVRYFLWLGNVLRLDFGRSYVFQEPVWDVIRRRFPISLFFGVTSLVLAYGISVPLGLIKAMKHRGAFDTATSVLMFAGYVMPGYALGILLIVLLGGGSFFNVFPISGMVSDNWEMLAPAAKVVDFLHHMVLPMICYMIGEFAFLTLLMKNALLDEINKDYVRTAMAKGMDFRAAVTRHALRNSLIPLVTGLSDLFMVFFAGSLLIEKVFDIPGMGLLVFESMVGRDYNVVLGVIVFSSVLALLGRLFSDVLYAAVDPRIRFD